MLFAKLNHTGAERAAVIIGIAVLSIAGIAIAFGDKRVTNEKTISDDRKAILGHIDGIFNAYFRGDRDAIRRGHTQDWIGFPVRATGIVRGIDGYMQSADAALKHIPGVRYELLDKEVQIYGDMAVVYYVAREWMRADASGPKSILLRSVDIYRREAAGWNQCGSNIIVLPDDSRS